MEVFISHATEDADWARKLAGALKKSGLDAWEASSVLGAGANWALAVGQALEKADAMIVLLSPSYAHSDSAKREIEYAITSSRFRDRLFPVMVRPTDEFPWVLSQFHFERGEPSAVAKRIAKRLRAASSALN